MCGIPVRGGGSETAEQTARRGSRRSSQKERTNARHRRKAADARQQRWRRLKIGGLCSEWRDDARCSAWRAGDAEAAWGGAGCGPGRRGNNTSDSGAAAR
ncbi:hypothetical protein Scep_020813 [Stephania cephalantha]|uniref:Uncharacterized protein n=1 Tax=Stephania cephalantha TaxID=152367 RepID=A0AAP0F356_9MAGN